jgi:hypothetical protein
MIQLVDKGRPYKRYRPNPAEKVKLENNGLQWVLSSNVSAVGTNNDDLIIRFHNGSLYEYPNQAKLYEPMLRSNSKGHFVWVKLRRPKVAYQKIGSLPLAGDTQVTDEDIFNLVDLAGLAMMAKLEQMGMFIPSVTKGLDLISLNGLLG